ncbi:MAG: hypothetical protein NTW95_03195 [Candidatus Aminicenantes bacterium]|nr:hypothetical protein [Candidatus Aminicenantes bacterium]
MTAKSIKTFFILFLLAVIFFSFASDMAKTKRGGFFSDESTYFSIIQSLAFDHDLEYSRADIVRIRQIFWTGPMGVFLKKGPDGRLYYAKSFVYPLAAAPFFRLFGTHGILLANGLMIFFVLLMGFLLLRQHHPPGKSLAWTLIYLFASVAFIYIWWITADLFNFFVNFSGLFFFFYNFKKPAWNGLAGIFLALAVFSKPNNILHVGILFLLLLYQKNWKKFLLTALACLLVLSGLLYFSHAQTGSFNYQGGERRSFYGNFPFERSDFTFAGGGVPMSSDNYWNRFFLSPAIVVHNLFYYLFGRFTGMLVYFPSALFLLLFFFFQKKRPEDWFVLAAIGAAILFYILITPDNYFGGGGSLGNRYFFNVFPLFFFLGFRGRDGRFALLPLFVAAVFLAPVFMDPMYHSGSPRFPGISFPVKFFPPEKTQYATLPSNTNPRAFNKQVNDKYTLFFLNDNFHPMEDECFWTYSDQEHELFLLAPRQVQTFLVQLKNIPLDNQVRLQAEHKVQRVFIAAGGSREVTFSHIPGLRFDDRYLYHFKIKSSRSYCPYLADAGSSDQRWLGVQAHIEPGY